MRFFGVVALFLFVPSSFQLNTNLSLDIWNEIIIHPGNNVFSFGVSTDSTGFLSFSVHSPFYKIWASVVYDCPTHSSQYGYNLGLVNRRLIVNATQSLFVCSYQTKLIKGAIRASLYSNEYIIPGGCGRGSSNSFASSSIVTHWNNGDLPLYTSTFNDSAIHFNQWISTLNFYAVADPKLDVNSCRIQLNDNLIDNVYYHVYHIPLVVSGGSSTTFDNPSTSDVLNVLSHISSSDDTLLRGSLVVSASARQLKLREDNSYQIKLARHLGTASVVNVIAEYKTKSTSSVESSTFVAYAPTVFYTCEPAYKLPQFDFASKSNQLQCNLLSDSSSGSRFCIGLIMMAGFLYALTGGLFVYIRCGVALMMVSSLICLVFFYRYAPGSINNYHILAVGILVPVAFSLPLILFLKICCIRRSRRVPPVTSFERPPFYCNYGTISEDEIVDRGERNIPDWCPPHVESSSVNLFSVGSLYTGFADTNATSAQENAVVSASDSVGCCAIPRNQYRLRRVVRLIAVLPAVFLISCLLMFSIVNNFNVFKNRTTYLISISAICVLLIAPTFICKNMAFGISVATTGLYVALSCITMLFFPTSLLPYILLDQFMIITWPEERMDVYDISVYGRNDFILLAVWLCGSLFIGLLTMCLLRLMDSREYTSTRSHIVVLQQQTSSSGPTVSMFRRLYRKMNPKLTVPDAISSMHEVPTFVNSAVYEFDTPSQPQDVEWSTSSATTWVPQPFGERPTSSVASSERYGHSNRQRLTIGVGAATENPPPLVPMSRTQLAATGVGGGVLSMPSAKRPPMATRGIAPTPFDDDDDDDEDNGRTHGEAKDIL